MNGSTGMWTDIRNQFRYGSMVTRLILINIAVFIFINLGIVFARLFAIDESGVGWFIRIFTVPAEPLSLIMRPWTMATHMFSHIGFLHLLFNMLWLYWMGRIFVEYLGQKKLLPVYILGALTGMVFFVLSFNIFPGLHTSVASAEALGASAGVMAIVLATATLLPEYTIHLLFIGPVKLKWIALVAVILDLIGIQGWNSGGHLAHLGGALFGFLFIKRLQKGDDWSEKFYRLVNGFTSLFVTRRAPKMHYRGRGNERPRSRRRDQSRGETEQARIDDILDKIAASGYESLNKEEKDFLFKVSGKK